MIYHDLWAFLNTYYIIMLWDTRRDRPLYQFKWKSHQWHMESDRNDNDWTCPINLIIVSILARLFGAVDVAQMSIGFSQSISNALARTNRECIVLSIVSIAVENMGKRHSTRASMLSQCWRMQWTTHSTGNTSYRHYNNYINTEIGLEVCKYTISMMSCYCIDFFRFIFHHSRCNL